MTFRVLIVRLSPFHDVVKSTTHQFLYGECARILDDDCIDFAFLPGENARKRREPLVSHNQRRPLREFDVILITNSYAVELINLPYLMKCAGIPYRAAERTADPHTPLLIMGGSNALSSQAMMYSEDEALVDAVFFGEGETHVTEMIRALSQVPADKRRAVLASLQGTVTGLRVFGAPRRTVEKAIYAGTNTELLASAKQALFDSPEALTVRLMISYDCPSFCTFCFEGWERKPYREVPVEELIRAARHLKAETGADTLEVTAFNFNTHTDITRIIIELNKIFAQVNLMSQRTDILASSQSLAPFECAAGKRQYTLGVEGISERMRSYFNKNLSEPVLMKALGMLMAQDSVKEIKLFFILAGIETADDFTDFSHMLAAIAELKTQYGHPVRILCSFGLLVRMPFTPLQYERLMLTPEEWEPVVQQTKLAVESAGYEFRLTYPYEEYFLSQTLVMTNAYAAPVLAELADKDIVYDQTLPAGTWDYFKSRIPVTPELTAEKDDTYPFAFRSVVTHTSAHFLYERFLAARRGEEMPTCMGSTCRGCGSCTPAQRGSLTAHTITMPTAADTAALAALLREKQRAQPVYIVVTLPAPLARAHQETKDAWVMRTLGNIKCKMKNNQTPLGKQKKREDNISKNGQPQNTTSPADITEKFLHFTFLIDSSILMSVSSPSSHFGLSRWFGDAVYAVFPFSNSGRQELKQALSDAGYNVYDAPFVPQQFTVTFAPGAAKSSASGATTSLAPKSPVADIPAAGVRTELEKTAQTLLNDMHLPYMLTRNGGCTNLVISPKALKKRIVVSCAVTDSEIKIVCTEKAVFKTNGEAHIQITVP